MSLLARGLAYLSALTIAFGGVAPWMTVDGSVDGASPLGLATVLSLALGAVVATAFRRRTALGVFAVLAGFLAVLTLWTAPDNPLIASAGGDAATSTGGGLGLVLLGAMLLYVASWLPAPRTGDSAGQREQATDELG